MPGRRIPSEEEFRVKAFGFVGAQFTRRRLILKETLQAFIDAEPLDRYSRLAMRNLQRWRSESREAAQRQGVFVLRGDWGDVTLKLSKTYGVCFAVLNMANAYVPGGAYVEGAAAQEENMYRRTDCHFHIGNEEYDADLDRYRPAVTRLLLAKEGRVYLDVASPRVCIRGSENRSRSDLGYRWLPDDEVFPFYELRASAQDLRDGSPFDPEEARWRIAAQLDTLRQYGIRHAVLGAFGCGAFRNPGEKVARLYKEEIEKRRNDFSVIAFAIFASGYGPDNYAAFANAFSD